MMKFYSSILLSVAMVTVAAAASEAGDAPASVFAGTLAQSIAAIIIFTLLLAVLWKFAWGPILGGLQDREGKIRKDLEHAEQSAKQASATLAQYQKELAEAHAKAKQIIDQGRADATKIAAELKDQTQTELQQMKERARRDINDAKEQALADIYTKAATLGTDIAGKILKRDITVQDQDQLVQESVAAMPSR